MLSLQHPYIAVAQHGGASYGGGQQFSGSAMIRRCGCGVVAATDLLFYLSRWHLDQMPEPFRAFPSDGPVPFPVYTDCLLRMNRGYFPMIPYAGINGVMLMAGVELFCHRYGMPYSARWCFAGSKIWDRTAQMLREDIPVIMSVGPNFPFFWQNKRTRFYRKNPAGDYVAASGARAHYFTVTGMDEEWLRISSWGRRYYLNRREFMEYMRRDSLSFTSNVLLVEGG